jgi:hypothetical protein
MTAKNHYSSQQLLKLFLAALLCSSAPAYAYLDPGTGSIIIQGLIGAIAAGSITAKLYWHQIKHKIDSFRNSDTVAEGEETEDTKQQTSRD